MANKIHVVNKGKEGEREIAKKLNAVVQEVRVRKGYDKLETHLLPFQRNQNQTAVGGDDLTNPFKLSIEVKRQEDLSINTWWKQCLKSALDAQGYAILIFRQNRKKWRVMLSAPLPITRTKSLGPVRVEIDLETFLTWFEHYYEHWLDNN